MMKKFRPNLNHVKIALAIIMFTLDIAGAISSWVGSFYPGAATFALLSIVTLDYIRIVRKELKLGSWYKLDSIDR